VSGRGGKVLGPPFPHSENCKCLRGDKCVWLWGSGVMDKWCVVCECGFGRLLGLKLQLGFGWGYSYRGGCVSILYKEKDVRE